MDVSKLTPLLMKSVGLSRTLTWITALPKALQAAASGFIWVLIILGLGWTGVATSHLYRWFVFAGLVNGGVLSILVVSLASEKFQAAVLGAVGGTAIDNIASQQTLAQRSIKAFAEAVHTVVHSLITGIGDPSSTSLISEGTFERAVVVSVWTSAFVILASLIGSWILRLISSRSASRADLSPPEKGLKESG
jgi:hypothetical protein